MCFILQILHGSLHLRSASIKHRLLISDRRMLVCYHILQPSNHDIYNRNKSPYSQIHTMQPQHAFDATNSILANSQHKKYDFTLITCHFYYFSPNATINSTFKAAVDFSVLQFCYYFQICWVTICIPKRKIHSVNKEVIATSRLTYGIKSRRLRVLEAEIF